VKAREGVERSVGEIRADLKKSFLWATKHAVIIILYRMGSSLNRVHCIKYGALLVHVCQRTL